VKYNIDAIVGSEAELISAVKTKVRVFNEQNLNDFGTVCRYSKLIRDIDDTVTSIIGNSTELIAYKDLNPILNSSEPFTVYFRNPLKSLNSAYIHPYIDNHAVSSTYFTYNGALCKIEDDGHGAIRIVSLTYGETEHTTVVNVGTVDYATGTIVFDAGLNISSYEGSAIRLRVVCNSKDITASQNDIIRIKDDDIFINVFGERA
jgi:hypothetical protein